MNTGSEVWPHHGQVQEDVHCPGPAGHTIPDPGLGTLLAHVHPTADQHP